jgi:hypothetical protein
MGVVPGNPFYCTSHEYRWGTRTDGPARATIQGFDSERAKSNQCASQVKIWHVENLRRKLARDTIITATKRRYKRHSAKVEVDHAEQPILVAAKKKNRERVIENIEY